MFFSIQHGLWIIGNPRCATASICKSLHPSQAHKNPHVTLHDFRASIRGRDFAWRDWDALLVVRDPVQRFLSACAGTKLQPWTVVDEWEKQGEQLGLPPEFTPQHFYLGRHRYIVGLPWLAEWFNHMGFPSLKRVNVLAENPRACDEGLRLRIEGMYAEDIRLLGRGSTSVPLWSPDGSPRFLWGECAECVARWRRSQQGT